MPLPGVMGGVGFPASGELGYPGSDRPGCGGSATLSAPPRRHCPPPPPGAGTHPVDGRLAVGAEASALPVELLSRLREEESPRGLAPGDSRPPVPPAPCPLSPLRYLVVGSGIARGGEVLAHALLQPVAGVGGGRSGGLGGTGSVLGTGRSVLPALEVLLRRVSLRGGGSAPMGRGGTHDGPGMPRSPPARVLTSLEYARLRLCRGSCWLGGGPG